MNAVEFVSTIRSIQTFIPERVLKILKMYSKLRSLGLEITSLLTVAQPGQGVSSSLLIHKETLIRVLERITLQSQVVDGLQIYIIAYIALSKYVV